VIQREPKVAQVYCWWFVREQCWLGVGIAGSGVGVGRRRRARHDITVLKRTHAGSEGWRHGGFLLERQTMIAGTQGPGRDC
jgi:hypothetical protein